MTVSWKQRVDITRLLRLKGGDPAIFGRVQEEVDTLNEHHIAFEIVPG